MQQIVNTIADYLESFGKVLVAISEAIRQAINAVFAELGLVQAV